MGRGGDPAGSAGGRLDYFDFSFFNEDPIHFAQRRILSTKYTNCSRGQTLDLIILSTQTYTLLILLRFDRTILQKLNVYWNVRDFLGDN